MVVTMSIFSSVFLYFAVFSVSSAAVKVRTNYWIRFILVALFPIIMGGVRYYVGADYGSYLWGLDLIKDQSLDSIFTISQFLEKPIAFYALEKLISLTNSTFLFYAVTSAFCYIPAILYIMSDWDKKDDEYDVASRSLFMYLLWFYTFGWAAIKQGIALGFCFYGLKFVFGRKPIRFVITIIIAALFHPSAIVFLPVYFLWSAAGDIKIWKKIFTIGVCFISIAAFDYLVGRFGGTYSDYVGQEVYGRNLTFWIMLGWLILFLAFRNDLLQLDHRNDLLIVLFAIGTALQFLGFTNAFTKRIGEYFLVTQCLLLPQLTCVFTVRSRKIAWWLIMLFNLFLFVMQGITSTITSGFLPFKFII